MLLHSQHRQREFVDCAKRVLFSFCREIVDNERCKGAIIDYRKMRNRLLALRYAIGLKFDEKMKSAGLRINHSCISVEELWALYVTRHLFIYVFIYLFVIHVVIIYCLNIVQICTTHRGGLVSERIYDCKISWSHIYLKCLK